MTIKNSKDMGGVTSFNLKILLQRGTEKLIHIDTGIHDFLGYKINDLLSSKLHFSKLIHEDDQDITSDLFSLASQTVSKTINFRCRQKNGRIICLKGCYCKQYNQASDTLTIQLQLIDAKSITTALNAHLLESNFTAMMDNSDDYIYFKDRNHVFTGASQTLVNLTDPSEHWKDLLGKTDYDVFPKAYADTYYQLEKQVFSGELEVAHEIQEILDIQGNSGWVDNRKYPIKDTSGTIIGLFGIARDITGSKLLEASLQESEERFQTAFIQAPLGIAIIDSLTGDFYDINPAYAKIVGSTIEELKAINWMEITHPDDVQEDIDNMARMNAGETSGFNMQKRYFCSDGRIVWINMTIAAMQVKDKSKPRHFCMIEDITKSKEIQISLQESERRYGDIFENALTEIFVFDDETYKFIRVNHGACENLGYSNEELTELTPLDIKPEMTLEKFNQLLTPLRNGAESIIQFETIHQRKDGSLYPTEVHVQRTDFLSSPAFVAIILDITERKIAEKKLQLSAKVFSETNEGIAITNAENIILDVNPSLCKMTGYTKEELIGKTPRIFSSEKQDTAFYAAMWKSINEQGYWQGEVWNRKKEGTLYAERLSISTIIADDGKVLQYIGIFTDITQSKRQQETLEQMAHYDALTKLPNRALLADRFKLALAHSQRQKNLLAVCFLDLDNFKSVNDLYGHEIGDYLLIEVTHRIKVGIRAEDTASRQGGDEFALLLGNIESFSQCERLLARLIESLSKPYYIHDHSIFIGASAGITLYPNDDADFDTLMRHADQAMYQAKLAGRNRYHLFNAEQDHLIAEKHIELKAIEKALSNNEFCLYYQPKVDMTTGNVFGAEALIRWNHPEKGLILPLEFLPIIDATKLEILIGNWVINEALIQLNDWQELGIEIEVSINISSYHLQSATFVTDLEAALALYPKVVSKYLQLEVLESSALGDLESISKTMKSCIDELGINLALDDFGTGYSSLTHLRNLPVQTIKIDQTFIRDVLDDPDDYAIIESVIGLAKSFHRKVIAEGVETSSHGLMLLAIGCNNAQGYSISHPIPALDFPNWLANYTPNQEWISYANKAHTKKEIKITIFNLTLIQFQKNIENNLQSSPNSTGKKPILNRTQCHCSVWIRQARQKQLFDENWLMTLKKAHSVMHDIADNLLNKYQKGDVTEARRGLKDFHAAIEKIDCILREE
ncbi:MAG: PAS domain S-box protein [Methyloprofundus sp.]|nr:PAS domain S-box protein [Methyloprofundus sp.]